MQLKYYVTFTVNGHRCALMTIQQNATDALKTAMQQFPKGKDFIAIIYRPRERG